MMLESASLETVRDAVIGAEEIREDFSALVSTAALRRVRVSMKRARSAGVIAFSPAETVGLADTSNTIAKAISGAFSLTIGTSDEVFHGFPFGRKSARLRGNCKGLLGQRIEGVNSSLLKAN